MPGISLFNYSLSKGNLIAALSVVGAMFKSYGYFSNEFTLDIRDFDRKLVFFFG